MFCRVYTGIESQGQRLNANVLDKDILYQNVLMPVCFGVAVTKVMVIYKHFVNCTFLAHIVLSGVYNVLLCACGL